LYAGGLRVQLLVRAETNTLGLRGELLVVRNSKGTQKWVGKLIYDEENVLGLCGIHEESRYSKNGRKV
jgi:hypothetical protein